MPCLKCNTNTTNTEQNIATLSLEKKHVMKSIPKCEHDTLYIYSSWYVDIREGVMGLFNQLRTSYTNIHHWTGYSLIPSIKSTKLVFNDNAFVHVPSNL